MQQNNDNIRHHANPVKQTSWYSQIITLLLTLCLLMTATVSMATETLLSQGRTATQSSTDYDGPPNLAVDGNTNGDWYVGYSVTHTAYETQPWWQVDLAQVATLSQVTLWNRIDCCSDRTANFYVLTSATDMTGQSLNQLLADPAVTAVLVPTLGSSPSITVQLNNAQARYVRVQLVGDNWLHLAEVQVFGTASIPTNVPPSVTLTSPSQGVNYIQGATISLVANAADSDGIITKVEFYDGTTLINTDTTAPYNYNWATNEIGPHNLTAKVYDDGVLVTTSAVVLVTVSGTGTSAIPPPNAIQCASEEEICTLPTGVTATVWYGFEMSWFSQTGVTGSINCSNTVFGDPVMGYSKSCWYVAANTTTNTPPTVTLTSPSNGASYNQGNSIPFAATAADSDGTIAKVEFYDGSTLIYTATTAPYSIGVSASTIGTHTVTAVATDNNGATAISNTAQVTINAVTNTTPQAYYIHTDQLNTPRLITDNNNQAVWRWDNWEPFGNYITDEDPGNTGNKFTYNPRFAGQYYDAETGLSYNYFRDYNPQTGRYLQSDPIGLDGGQFSPYAYVSGDPLLHQDPFGLDTAVAIGGKGGNPFGHVAIAFSDSGVYSFGTGTKLGSSFTEYLAEQARYRNTTVIILDTTVAQEKLMKDYLRQFSNTSLPNPLKTPEKAYDTCAARTNGALLAGGYTDPRNIIGASLFGNVSPFPVDSYVTARSYTKKDPIQIPVNGKIPKSLSGFNP